MKKCLLLLLFIQSLLLLVSCASTIQVYDGDKLPDSEVATLSYRLNYYVYKIDGQDLKKPFGWSVIKVKPGKHTLYVAVEKSESVTHYGGTTTIKREFRKVVMWDAKAGHKYELQSEGKKGAINIKVKVVDITN